VLVEINNIELSLLWERLLRKIFIYGIYRTPLYTSILLCRSRKQASSTGPSPFDLESTQAPNHQCYKESQ